MENQIYHLVNRLMEVFDVEQPALGKQWADQLISSARRTDIYIKPVSQSLDEIQQLRPDSNVANLYNRLSQQEQLPEETDAILHLASNLVADNNTRKSIKIHNMLRAARAKKLQQQQQFQQQQATTNNVRINQSTVVPNQVTSGGRQNVNQTINYSTRQNQQQPIQTPMSVQQHIQQAHHHIQQQQQQNHQQQQAHQMPPPQAPSQHQQPPPPTPLSQKQFQQPQPPKHQTLNHSFQVPSTRSLRKPSHFEATQLANTSHYNNQHNISSPMVTITPGSQKTKREKYRRRKNDVLYQKMKNFLSQNQFLSFDFKKIDWTQVPPIPPLSSMSVKDQESALINDLLYVLIGTEGKYIRMQPSRESPNKHTIGVEKGGDELVYYAATRIIKICPLYSTVVHYAEDVNFGLVNQALAAPVRDLVKEYLTLISNLQFKAMSDDMTLQSMWLTLQTIYNRMEALKQILDQISNSCYGGHTLSVLHNRMINFSTDPKTHEFCLRLMQAASEPYFEILERWLYLGVVEDPYGEFFIEDTDTKSEQYGNLFSSHRVNNHTSKHGQPNVDIDAFWRTRFTCDDYKVPDFLRTKQEKILDIGKYLSVVRQYGKKVFRPMTYEPLIYCPEQRKYDERVDEAYKFASKELLALLLVENKLIDRLHSLKRYFLFSSGDFFVQFMDMADEELSKTKDEISLTRLGSLLELALRTSSCNNDPYKDDVHIKMSDGSLYQIMASINSTGGGSNVDSENTRLEYCHSSDSLFAWESLTLSYDVPWPLSMIICKNYCQTLYQMMFRHLFCCKFILRKIEATWRVNRLMNFEHYKQAFLLRNKMLQFVHNLLFYISEIIEPSFQILIGKFKDGGIENVNEVIELHRAFLSGLVHESMLTDNELLGHVTKLLLSCMDFSAVIESSLVTNHNSSTSNGDPGELFKSRIHDINQKFENQLMLLLDALALRNQDYNASSKLQNIFYRLDFNNFYTKS